MIASSLFVAVLASGVGSVAQEAPQPCCFTNPRYTGVCREVPQGEETCADILRYLNNPNAVGKAYCGNTDVRLGWAQVACEENEQTAGGGDVGGG